MIDLNSRKMQATCKKLRWTSLTTTILFLIITVTAGGLAIWAAKREDSVPANWAEIMFIVLLCVIAAYSLGIIVFRLIVFIPYNRQMNDFVAESIYANEEVIKGDNVELTLLLAGDKLTVINKLTEDALQIDLAPVKSYTNVCAGIASRTRKFLRDYYYVNSQKGAVSSANLSDAIGRKPKLRRLACPGKKYCPLIKLEYFVRKNVIK